MTNSNLKKIWADPNLSLDAIMLKVREFDNRKPNLKGYKQFLLRESTKMGRIATYWTILNGASGEIHHNSLSLRTLRKRKDGWYEDDKFRITLDDKDGQNEIARLVDGLSASSILSGSGDYLVINAENIDSKLHTVLSTVGTSEKRLSLLSQILDWINDDTSAHKGLISLAADKPHRTKSLVAALNYGRYRKNLDIFKQMIEDDNLLEKDYQAFLEENLWIFGSEFSEMLPRSLVQGDIMDFPVRRTVDGYLDVIEIKTPLKGKSPMSFDKSHKTFFSNRELAMGLGQIETYMRNLERERDRIQARFSINIESVRGILVIGRDESKEHIQELRMQNGNRAVQVITFDQLLRIGEQILQFMIKDYPSLSDKY